MKKIIITFIIMLLTLGIHAQTSVVLRTHQNPKIEELLKYAEFVLLYVVAASAFLRGTITPITRDRSASAKNAARAVLLFISFLLFYQSQFATAIRVSSSLPSFNSYLTRQVLL